MKSATTRVVICAVLAVGLPTVARAQQPTLELPVQGQLLASDRDRASYGLGVNIARSLQADGLSLNLDAFMLGFRDMLAGREPRASEQACQEAMIRFQRAAMAELAAKNQKEGQEFLAQNARRPGVKVLENGLQYEVLAQGQGPQPKATDTVRTHYRGTFPDGVTFDTTYEDNEPAVFPVSEVIPGWTEALQRMRVGDKWRIVLPPELGYGDEPPPGTAIGPNRVLQFEIELLGIE